MKKIFFGLFFLTALVSSSQNRVQWDELISNEDSTFIYFKGKPFTGVGFIAHANGQLAEEVSFKDGKRDGLSRTWSLIGLVEEQANYKNGQLDGLFRAWYENNFQLEL